MTVNEKLRVGVAVVDKKWHKHGFEKSVVGERVVEKPVVEKPVVEEPVVEKPVVEKPVVEELVVEKEERSISLKDDRVVFVHLSPKDLTASRLCELQLTVLLHKLSDWLLPEADLLRIENELRKWGGRVVDWNVALLTDRRRTCDLLRWFAPHHGLNLPPTGECNESLCCPVIRKPVAACSAKHSHSMSLYYRVEQIVGGAEYILQEYVPHYGILYKVYVVGGEIRIQLRPSLRAEKDGDSLEFNSQAMKRNGSVASEEYDMAMAMYARHEQQVSSFSAALRTELGLTLFGWDLIFEEQTERMFVIDVNYFPGFDDIGFIDLLCNALQK
jgi:hypothetical protein